MNPPRLFILMAPLLTLILIEIISSLVNERQSNFPHIKHGLLRLTCEKPLDTNGFR
jgi:hypothetical protein